MLGAAWGQKAEGGSSFLHGCSEERLEVVAYGPPYLNCEIHHLETQDTLHKNTAQF